MWAAVALVAVVTATCEPGRPPDGRPYRPLTGEHPVVVAAGDIACPGDPCDQQRETAAIVRRIDPTVVLALGDNQYTNGTLAEFEASYDPTWGEFLARTRPVPGNHEYRTDDAAGYFDYFGARASPQTHGDYAFDVGRWRVVALNSAAGGAITQEQIEWVRSDLHDADRRCELAYWHHPLFSSGAIEGNDPTPDLEALWALLVDEGVDVVLNGHAHQYERFAPLDADGQLSEETGIREFVVGTGGGTPHAFEQELVAGSSERFTDVFGVLEMELRPREYAWRFVSAEGRVLDQGAGECHR